MMNYDFTTVMDRRGKDATAIDNIPYDRSIVKEGFSVIPMWVADMNFATAPSIIRAMQKRLEHPLFGYFPTSDAYYDAVIRWQQKRNGAVGLTRECIGYENGVLGCLISAVNAFCTQGDAVLLHSPTYIGFTGNLGRNGYQMIFSPLVQDEDGVWRMDYEDMDRKLKEFHIHVAVFCSPHNPCGRVWERWEIEKAMEVYAANHCVVISDEIWSDIVLNGNRHIPTQSVSEDAKKRTIAIYAPSKTFNLAGLVGSYHIVYDEYLRDRLNASTGKSGYNHMNVLSMHALIGGYGEEGEAWVDELCDVLSANVNYAYEYIRAKFDGVSLFKPQGTYMMYLNCEGWCKAHGKSMDELLQAGASVGVIWQDGRPFRHPYGIRINLALPQSLLREALERLDRHVFNA